MKRIPHPRKKAGLFFATLICLGISESNAALFPEWWPMIQQIAKMTYQASMGAFFWMLTPPEDKPMPRSGDAQEG